MKAVVNTAAAPDSLRLQDVPSPTPERGEVLVAVRAVGICGTDVSILRGKYVTRAPLIIGHEFGGEIIALGDGVTGWNVGDRVVAENTCGACGRCELCRTGKPHICAAKRAYGSESPGAMAELACFAANALHRIPDKVTFEEAAVVEPLAVVNRGVVERAEVAQESAVVVLGPGSIGLLAVQVCKAAGARDVILAGTAKDAARRLPLGLSLGADCVVNTAEEDLRAIVARRTGGKGADLVIEAAGSVRAAQEAVHLAGRGKVISAIGLMGAPVSFEWDQAVVKELDVRFSKSSSYLSWSRALTMIEGGRVNAKALITHRFPLAEFRAALDAVESGEAVKAILLPYAESTR